MSMTMTITLLFTQRMESSVTKKLTIHRRAGTICDYSDRAPADSSAEGGEHHVGDYNVSGHTRRGSSVTKKRDDTQKGWNYR